ncbi:MAG: hypothetical protein AB8B74_02640 [Crocinitomicaceae bacterium]
MKTVEEIVMTKSFFELTDQERLLVKELAKNQEEYDQLKILLSGTSSFFSETKVTASEGMRDHIMEKLYPPTPISVKWYESFWLFLFPENKSFYQYPAFQIVSVLLVFIGLFSFWQNPLQNDELAQNNNSVVAKEHKTLRNEEEQSNPMEDIIDTVNHQEAEIPSPKANKVSTTSADRDDKYIEMSNNENKDKNYFVESEALTEETDLRSKLDDEVVREVVSPSVPAFEPTNNVVSNIEMNHTSSGADMIDESTVTLTEAKLQDNYSFDVDKETRFEKQELSVVEIQKKKSNFKAIRLNGNGSTKNNSVTNIEGLVDLFFEVK